MKSKDFLRSKGILSNDSHHFIIDFHDGREINLGDLLEEYAQQSQPSGMRCVRASDPPKNSNPVYIRYKHAEGYAKTLGRYCNGVWEWCDTEIEAIYPEFVLTLEWLDESSPAGAAEGVKRYETVVNDTGFDKSSEHYVNNVFMRNANVWSDEHDWMMTKDRFVDVVSLFFTTTQPASEGISKIRQVMNWISQCVDEDHDLEVSEIKMIWNDLSDAISLIESTPHSSEGMAEALAKFFAKECKVGDPLLSIIDSIYDDWKLVYDKLRIETSFSEAAIQANKFVIEKYASLSPGVEDNQTKKQ